MSSENRRRLSALHNIRAAAVIRLQGCSNALDIGGNFIAQCSEAKMKKFDTRTYNVSDFVEWEARGQLELSPDFQRRAVWSQKAKSYLVDTIIRGKPMPKLLITQDVKDKKNTRIVVDGQQRLRAILEFVAGDFPISRAHNREFAGRRFERLPDEVQSEFLKYEVGVDLLYDLPYRDILDIFARLNTYTVKLNGQELLNAKYVGYFKQTVYDLGYRYVEYWIESKVLTKAQVTRMLEAELAADLLVSIVDEIQTNKNIEQFYRKYEDDFDSVDEYEQQFDNIMSYIGAIYPSSQISLTNWSRVHLFYTLFTVVGHALYGLKNFSKAPRPKLTAGNVGKVRVILDDISSRYDLYTESKIEESIPKDWAIFIERSRRATTDTGARLDRTKFVCDQLAKALV